MSRIHMTALCFSDRFAALTAGYPRTYRRQDIVTGKRALSRDV